MSLDKFLKKNKSSKEPDKIPVNNMDETPVDSSKDQKFSLESSNIDEKSHSDISSENYISIPYDELLEIIQQVPRYSDYLTQVIWIIEDGRITEIENYLIKNYSISKTFTQVLVREAKKIISEGNG